MLPSRTTFPFYYHRGQGWRLASSWDKSNNDNDSVTSDKSKAKSGIEQSSKSELDKWQEEFHARIERLRERVENHPYEMLFGASVKNRVWNPWDHDAWSIWMRSLGLAEPEESKSTTQKHKATKDRSLNGTAQATARSPSAESKSSSTATRMTKAGSEAGDIDLITLRRVPKSTPDRTTAENVPKLDTEFDIPVKTFKPGSSVLSPLSNSPRTESAAAELRAQTTVNSEDQSSTVIQLRPPMERTVDPPKTWLTREGFSKNSESISNPESNNEVNRRSGSTDTNKSVVKLESALDRHLRAGPILSQDSDASASSAKYKSKENRTDDIDLLRASDIRASSGRLRRPAQESADCRQARRESLRVSYEKQQQDLEARYKNELAAETDDAAQAMKLENTHARSGIEYKQKVPKEEEHDVPSDQQLNMNNIGTNSNDKAPANVDPWGYDLAPRGLENSYQDELDNKSQNLEAQYIRQQEELMEAERRQPKRVATDAALEEEIEKQKTAMAAIENRTFFKQQGKQSLDLGEGDVSSNVHQFACQDRWYKRKAPHALQREAQKAKDVALVREIQDIYEERYGKIETKHRQINRPLGMEDREDPAVQEGLRAYDEKIAAAASVLGTKGKIAATDLDTREIALLAGPNTPPSPSVALETKAHSKSASQPQELIESSTSEEGQSPVATSLSNDTDKAPQSLETRVDSNIEQVKTLSQDCIRSVRNAIGRKDGNLGAAFHTVEAKPEVKVPNATAVVDKQIDQPTTATARSVSPKVVEQCSVQRTQEPTASISTSKTIKERTETDTIPVTTTYKVLAYDPAKDAVATATTTSSLFESSSPPRSASAILSHLDNPVRYFDHFEPLEAAGYELVAGSRKMLVFKKVRDEDPTDIKSMQATTSKSLQARPLVQGPSTSGGDNGGSSLTAKLEKQNARPINNNFTSAFGGPDVISYTQVQGSYYGNESSSGSVIEMSETTKEKESTARSSPAVPPISAETTTRTTNLETSSASSAKASSYPPTSPNPIDGTLAHDPLPSSSTVSQPPTSLPSSQPVRRQEPFFSGCKATRAQYKERRRQLRLAAKRYHRLRSGSKRSEMWKNAKRMMWTGAWVAACLYVVGALLEEVYRPRRERQRELARTDQGV